MATETQLRKEFTLYFYHIMTSEVFICFFETPCVMDSFFVSRLGSRTNITGLRHARMSCFAPVRTPSISLTPRRTGSSRPTTTRTSPPSTKPPIIRAASFYKYVSYCWIKSHLGWLAIKSLDANLIITKSSDSQPVCRGRVSGVLRYKKVEKQ